MQCGIDAHIIAWQVKGIRVKSETKTDQRASAGWVAWLPPLAAKLTSSSLPWIWILAGLSFAMQFIARGFFDYGYFEDEFYYMACARHLDWAYVDLPGFSLWVLRLVMDLFGTSPAALRLVPALAGAAVVVLTGR
ncbi:hypothetical protein JW933_00885, partial [candidate division FCPU426 bacterium]|nr:hypothetical protein [candidate division FCPU426 bacterium]